MATAKQILANRANALKSTGPRTSIGRAKSARNSLRHGAFARTIVLDNESRTRFQHLLSSLLEEFKPETTTQTALVEAMAVARWRQMRIWAMETAALSNEIRNHQLDTSGTPPLDAPTRTALAFRALADRSRSLEIMSRDEDRYCTQFDQALVRLMKLQENSLILRNEPN